MSTKVLLSADDVMLGDNTLKFIQQQSLTKILQDNKLVFSVKLLYLGRQANNHYWQDISQKAEIFIRDVVLMLGNIPVVRASSICDLDCYFWRDYLDCGNQSLGARLFNGEDKIARTEFEYQLLNRSHPLVVNYCEQSCYARQSIFDYQGQQLLLTENFLPSLENLL